MSKAEELAKGMAEIICTNQGCYSDASKVAELLEPVAQEALTEAREAGRHEAIDGGIIEGMAHGEARGRREAFEEAARACERIMEEQCNSNREAEHGAYLCKQAIRALADEPPPDTAFRDGKPEPWEEEAHDGPWVVSGWGKDLAWVVGADEVKDFGATIKLRWRPVTGELFPAPWPVKEFKEEDQHG